MAAARQAIAETILAKRAAGESVTAIVEWLRAFPSRPPEPNPGKGFTGGVGTSLHADAKIVAM